MKATSAIAPSTLGQIADDPNSRRGALPFYAYLLFIVSWFLHFGYRFPVLGQIRFDLILGLFLAACVISRFGDPEFRQGLINKRITILLVYCIAVIPFVEWPGSVLRNGLFEFIKAIFFYYCTVAFVRSEKQLRLFVYVFLACQLFRIAEPLYLNVTEGYWGSFASMADWEYLNRLSGAPSDTVNPNGLAFIVCTAITFLYFLAGPTIRSWLISIVAIAISIYVLSLTGSRSGMFGLALIFLAVVLKSRRRLVILAFGAIVVVVGFPLMGSDMQDRYLSAIGKGPKNEGTAEDRVDFMVNSFEVAMRRPVFGHGLGTSREANANFGRSDQLAHNLYAEVAQELGFVGLWLYLWFMISIVRTLRAAKANSTYDQGRTFLIRLLDATEVWLWMNVGFSIASYGLLSYEWYMLGGLAAVLLALLKNARRSESEDPIKLARGKT